MREMLSIILPTFNESENIPILINRLEELMKNCEFEVLVMDDNSPDQTWKIAKELSLKRPWLKSVRRMTHKGLNPAVVDGFNLAEGDYFLVMDSDLQHDENVIPKFLEAFKAGADIVIGSRKTDGGKIENWNMMRRFISFVATKMAYFVLPRSVTDPMSGFFAVRREVYLEIAKDINSGGFKILLEILARAKNKKIVEVGYTFKKRVHGESKLSTKVMGQYIEALYNLSIGKYIPFSFIKYCLVGASGIIVNLGSLGIARNLFGTADSFALIGSIEISLLSNFFLNNIWTFKDQRLKGASEIGKGLVSFHFVCLTGALINYSLAMFLKNRGLANIYFADFFGIVVATCWNYVLNRHATWTAK